MVKETITFPNALIKNIIIYQTTLVLSLLIISSLLPRPPQTTSLHILEKQTKIFIHALNKLASMNSIIMFTVL